MLTPYMECKNGVYKMGFTLDEEDLRCIRRDETVHGLPWNEEVGNIISFEIVAMIAKIKKELIND